MYVVRSHKTITSNTSIQLIQTRNSFLNQSVLIFLIRFFPSLASTIVLVLFSRSLSKEMYGEYQHFWVLFYVLSTVACLGIHALVITYSPQMLRKITTHIRGRVFAGILAWIVLMACLFGWLQMHTRIAFFPAAAFLALLSVNMILEAILIVMQRFRVLFITSFLYSILFCLIHILFLEYTWNFTALFLLIILIAVLRLLVTSIHLSRKWKETEPAEEPLSMAPVRTLWLHMGLYDLVQKLSTWVDKLLLGFILSSELFAVYFNGSVDIPFLPLIFSAAGSAGLIQLASGDAGDKKQKTLHLLRQTGRVLSCIAFPLFFFLVFFRRELFTVVLKHYDAATDIFLMAVMIVPLRAYSFTTVLQHHHKGRTINAGALMEITLACLLMYPLYLVMGLPGIALSFVLSTYLQGLFYLYKTSRLLDTGMLQLIPIRNWTLKLVLFAAVFAGIYHALISATDAPLALLWGALLLAAVILLSLFLEIRGTGKQGENYPPGPR